LAVDRKGSGGKDVGTIGHVKKKYRGKKKKVEAQRRTSSRLKCRGTQRLKAEKEMKTVKGKEDKRTFFGIPGETKPPQKRLESRRDSFETPTPRGVGQENPRIPNRERKKETERRRRRTDRGSSKDP